MHHDTSSLNFSRFNLNCVSLCWCMLKEGLLQEVCSKRRIVQLNMSTPMSMVSFNTKLDKIAEEVDTAMATQFDIFR